MDVVLDSLQVMEKGYKEFVKECTQRWRESATEVSPSLLEKKMIGLLSNTFKTLYFEYLVRSFT